MMLKAIFDPDLETRRDLSIAVVFSLAWLVSTLAW